MKIKGREMSVYQVPYKAVRYIGRRMFGEIREKHKDKVAEQHIHACKMRVQKKMAEGGKLRVCFIVQETTLWEKSKKVYDLFAADPEVEADIFVIPHFEGNDIGRREIGEYGPEHEFYHSQYERVIDAIDEHGNWSDLKQRHYDYIFYQRPYDVLLPKQYRSDAMVDNALLCYIPYGPFGTKNFLHGMIGKNFFRNMRYVFCCMNAEVKHLNRLFADSAHEREFLLLGYPEMEPYLALGNNGNRRVHTLTWTPRWTIDSKVGGSHFFDYKDNFIELSREYPDIQFIIRPHPLMFDNFLAKGLITKEWERDYRQRLKDNRIELDEGSSVYETFERTDVLIADISSIMYNFFLTGKPMIYCPFHVDYVPEFAHLVDALYLAEDWSQVHSAVKQLIDGQDKKKLQRQELIRTNYSYHKDAAKKIYQVIRYGSNG